MPKTLRQKEVFKQQVARENSLKGSMMNNYSFNNNLHVAKRMFTFFLKEKKATALGKNIRLLVLATSVS